MSLGMTHEELIVAIQRLQEVNPMLGFRGCRLAIAMPELVQMQTRAVVEAYYNCKNRNLNPKCEIMIPLVGSVGEFQEVAIAVLKK